MPLNQELSKYKVYEEDRPSDQEFNLTMTSETTRSILNSISHKDSKPFNSPLQQFINENANYFYELEFYEIVSQLLLFDKLGIDTSVYLIQRFKGHCLYIYKHQLKSIKLVNEQRKSNCLVEFFKVQQQRIPAFENQEIPQWLKYFLKNNLLILDGIPTVYDKGLFAIQIFNSIDILIYEQLIDIQKQVETRHKLKIYSINEAFKIQTTSSQFEIKLEELIRNEYGLQLAASPADPDANTNNEEAVVSYENTTVRMNAKALSTLEETYLQDGEESLRELLDCYLHKK